MRQERRVLYCECANAAVLSAQAKQEVRQRLTEAGLRLDVVPDLCELASRKAPLLAELAGSTCLAVAACHPRAVTWLFAAGGAPLPEAGVTLLDMRGADTDGLANAVRGFVDRAVAMAADVPESECPEPEDAAPSPAGQPWFPVIDRDRCEDCGQCLSFCLFGVYTTDADGTTQVANPANCKYLCPACARVCPSAAIIFPKYPNAPINGGELKPGEVAEPLKIDKAVLLSGDTLKILQDRGKHALLFARESDEFRALQERMKHLSATGRALPLFPGKPPAAPASEEPK
jgi:NAD-dependent dihydropyrimidine dehydrogenase PreA subunit